MVGGEVELCGLGLGGVWGETGDGGVDGGGRVVVVGGGAMVFPDSDEVGEGAEDGYDGEREELGSFEEGGGGGGFGCWSVVWWVLTRHICVKRVWLRSVS